MNGIGQTMQPDLSMMVRALGLLAPDSVIELRALTQRGRKRTDAGYFDVSHHAGAAREAESLNASGAAVYVTLNPVDPQLLGRYSNRIEKFAQATTTDANIVRRAWLLLDFDPVRPKDTSATDAQLEQARELTRKAFSLLKGRGWPDPVVAESGNGMHLLYSLDLPNTPEVTEAVKAVLNALADKLDTAEVKVDRSVFNASRIGKLYGTIANKGDNTPATPWRLSRIVKSPEHADVVTLGQLRELVAEIAPTVEPLKTAIAEVRPGQRADFDLDSFLSRLGIETTRDLHNGRDRYKLANCPFNPEHGFGEAAIFRGSDGTLGFKCQHSTCADKHWQDVRALVDGPKELRRGPQAGARSAGGMAQHREAENAPAGDSEGNGWPDPHPLAVTLEPEPYPLDALPDTIRAAVEEVAGFVKAPIAMVASSALAALSLASQAHADVSRDEILVGPTSLFMLTIAESGERKTQADKMFVRPIQDYQDAQAEAAKPLLKNHRAALGAWEAKRNGVKDQIRQLAKNNKPTASMESNLRDLEHDKPEAPRVPKLIREDATPEGLAKKLQQDWPSAGVVSNEAGIVFGAHGMGKDSVMRNLALLNKLWDGGRYQSDRGDEERSRDVRGARLTMGLMIQETTLRAFFAQSNGLARGTGFLARFLVAWPDSTMGTRFYTPPVSGSPALSEFNQRITDRLNQPVPIDDDGILTPPMFPLTPAAKTAWKDYHDEIEIKLSSGGELYDVRDVASKSADNAARLAGLFQYFESAGGAIGEEAFEGASRIAAWHLAESRRFFGELALPVELADAGRLDTWLVAYCKRERTHLVGKNHARRHGPLRDGSALDAAIRELASLDRVRLVKDGKRLTIHVNPALALTEGAK